MQRLMPINMKLVNAAQDGRRNDLAQTKIPLPADSLDRGIVV